MILSAVEQAAVRESPFENLAYETERIPVIVVGNFPALGKLAAMRFLEWVQGHPERRGLAAHRQDARAFHPLGHAAAGQSWDTPRDAARAWSRRAWTRPASPTCTACASSRSTSSIPSIPRSRTASTTTSTSSICKGSGSIRRRALLIDCAQIGLERRADAGIGLARHDGRSEPAHAARRRPSWSGRSSGSCGGSTSGARSTRSGSARWAASASSWAASGRTATSASTSAARTTSPPRG